MLARMPPPDARDDPSAGAVEARLAARATLASEMPLEHKLAAIATADPLDLYPLGARRVRDRCLYLDPDRVHDESVFNVVALSVALEPQDEFDDWLVARVDEAIDNLVRRDGEALRRSVFEADLVRESGEYLNGCWGLPPGEAVMAAARFNLLPEESRRTFFALLVEHRSIEACLEEGLGPREILRERAVRAVEAILGPRPRSVARTELPDEQRPAEEDTSVGAPCPEPSPEAAP